MSHNHVKAVVIGDGVVGKTSLLITISTGIFPSEYIPTVFDNYSLNMTIGESSYSIGLWDTAGGEDYPRLRPLSYPQTDCFLLCFSISNKNSLENCYKYWYPEIQLFCPRVPIILVGTKSDLYNDLTIERSILVEYNDAIQVANKIHAIEYIETSALLNINLDKVFKQVAINGSSYSKLNKGYQFKMPPGFNIEATRYIRNAPGDKSKEKDETTYSDRDSSSSSSNGYDYNEEMNQYSYSSKKKNCIIN